MLTRRENPPHVARTSSRLRRGCIVALGALVALSGCGGGSSDSGSATRRSTTTTTKPVDHTKDLARGETAGIASQLSDVPGYRYVDPSAAETKTMLAALKAHAASLGDKGFFRAVSLHSVVADDASQNSTSAGNGKKETGFLQLYEFAASPSAAVTSADVAALGTGGQTPSDTFTANETEVVAFENPANPDSRWSFVWLRHGVQGSFDGADRAATERWVRAYLAEPERQPYENDVLAAQLVTAPGYAYVNWWTDQTQAIADAIGAGRAVSSHAVADNNGLVGGLVLAEGNGDPVALAGDLAGRDATPQPTTIAGVPIVQTTASGSSIFIWTRNGVVGAFLASDAATATQFLQTYLATTVS